MISMRNFRRIFKSSSYFNGRKKTKQTLLVSLILFVTFSILITVPTATALQTTERTSDTIVWNKDYSYDNGKCVQQTSDGGYIFLAKNSSFLNGYPKLLLIKTDVYGSIMWDKMYGGERGDYGRFIQQTSDDGYIIVGYTESYSLIPDDKDLWLLKTDVNGDLEWNYTYGGTGWDGGQCVEQTTDGGYVITGFTVSYGVDGDVWLIKTDEKGDVEWNKTYDGGTGFADEGYFVRQTSDGGYIITGRKDYFGVSDVWLIKTDEKGDHLWNKTYGIVGDDIGNCVEQTSNGGYIIIGTTSYGVEFDDVLLIKTDENGNAVWIKESDIPRMDKGEYVHQTSDGGYIIIGSTSLHWFEEILLIKTNENGDFLWNRTYGEAGSVFGGDETIDGGYVLLASTASVTKLMKVYVSPYIDNPDDITYEEDTTGHNITWYASDINPSNYTITRDGTIVIQESWNGGSITVSVDGLSVGNYTYTCIVIDDCGNTITDMVTVTVTSTSEEDSNFLGGALSLVLVAIVGALLVLGMILTKKKS